MKLKAVLGALLYADAIIAASVTELRHERPVARQRPRAVPNKFSLPPQNITLVTLCLGTFAAKNGRKIRQRRMHLHPGVSCFCKRHEKVQLASCASVTVHRGVQNGILPSRTAIILFHEGCPKLVPLYLRCGFKSTMAFLHPKRELRGILPVHCCFIAWVCYFACRPLVRSSIHSRPFRLVAQFSNLRFIIPRNSIARTYF